MSVTIGRCTADKIESYWRCVDTVARERRYLLFLEGEPIESTRRFVQQILENGWTQFYALHDGRVVGWCDVLPYRREGTRHVGHLGMGVLPEYRGQKIGERLIAATLDAAWQTGLARIELEVFASNTRAMTLYRKMGFVEEGRKRRFRHLDGVYDDNVIMALLRSDTSSSGTNSTAQTT